LSAIGELPGAISARTRSARAMSAEAAGPLVGKRITLCVGGSIAAYKAPILVRLLLRAGAIVQPVMTRSAQRFVGRATLSGLTGRTVHLDMFRGAGELHVELGRDSDLIAVVPATADLLARLAQGRADDLVTATAMCARCPVLMAPAMHPRMWAHPLTQSNVERLRAVLGWELLGPVFGEVASGELGLGRLLEPEQIFAAIERALTVTEGSPAAPSVAATHPLGVEGRHIVVTAGPTVEDLDPVRCLTNRSSGKMGFAIARSAALHGARVTLIAGPVALPTPPGVLRIDVRSALDMQAALASAMGEGLRAADALVMCAAVSDYRPKVRSTVKLKRAEGKLALELVPNPDLLAELGRARRGTTPFLLGFAVESEPGERLVALARDKLRRKQVDAVVANLAVDALGTDATRALLVTQDSELELGPGSKVDVAEQIIEFLGNRLE
jgi:phosphopantothenoylcysteine decarboxylase / phosphopantothenate---cysteine ligase